jgi:hypothetical protein
MPKSVYRPTAYGVQIILAIMPGCSYPIGGVDIIGFSAYHRNVGMQANIEWLSLDASSGDCIKVVFAAV